MKKPDIVSAAPYFMKAAMTILVSCLCLHGCIDHDFGTESNCGGESISASLVFGVRNAVTKALDPDEEKISDINLFIFNSLGVLEHRLYLSGSGAGSCNVRLLKNGIYSIYVCANFGYRINAASIEDLKNLKYYLAYPDDYSIGLPMSGYIENTKVKALRDKLETELLKLPATRLNGDPEHRLPNTSNISFEYIEGESILMLLDMYNICASSGSACTTGSLEPSHVLRAMGVPYTAAHGAIRFSFSRYNTEEEVDFVLEKLPPVIARLREISPYWKG